MEIKQIEEAKVSELIGRILIKIEVGNHNDEIYFTTDKGEIYLMYHIDDCCETVTIEDICGDLNDLIDTSILDAREDTSNENPEGIEKEYQQSFTWTFYNFRTIKGSVTIRWYGESNGYYSESVDFGKVDNY